MAIADERKLITDNDVRAVARAAVAHDRREQAGTFTAAASPELHEAGYGHGV
jgi:hypothetical protein